jgi:ribosomal protein S18 acetylase RimI-like enzyme
MVSDGFSIEPFSEQNDVKNFKMGDNAFQPLKTFLQKQALDFQLSRIAQTYVAIPNSEIDNAVRKVIGYVTLTCSEIELQEGYEITDCERANQYDFLPAIKIARLAVDERYRANGIGEELVDLAVTLSADVISTHVGCRFLIADAKPQAIKFYERCGFTLLDTLKNRTSEHPIMFVDLNGY